MQAFGFLLNFFISIHLSPLSLAAEKPIPGCTTLVENFCQELQSPARQGIWDMVSGKKTLKIRRGPTENDFPYAYYRGVELLLKNSKFLPHDLKSELAKAGYFEKLQRYLKGKPLSKFTIQERVEDTHLTSLLSSTWYSALKAVVLRRMSKLHPGYHKLRNRDRPPAWINEEKKIYADLRMEANRLRWINSPEWITAGKQFEEVRTEVLGLVNELQNISERTRNDFRDRLLKVTLTAPGTTEEHLDDGCAEDLDNAYYNSFNNAVQICAGLLTSSSTLFTMAHELSHALDPGSATYMDRVNSNLGKTIEKIKTAQCSSRIFPCDDWRGFKKNFSSLAQEIPIYKPDPENFYRCFQRRELTEPKTTYITDHVKRWVTNDLENLSKNSTFIKLIKKESELANGKIHPNPAYLNPCGLDNWMRSYDDHPVNTVTPLILYFTAEFSCTPEMGVKERMTNAIETAKSLQLIFNQRYAEMPGRFSSDATFASDGHAEDIVERVADSIGAEAVARILAKTPDLEERRLQFYSILADRCEEPSWKTRYPSEAEVENKYSWDPHTLGQQRILETLPSAMREKIQCEKDFELTECKFR